MKEHHRSQFVGRQISRLKYAKDYLIIVSTLLSTLSLLKLAFNLTLFDFLLLIPVTLLLTYAAGFILDKCNVFAYDLQAVVNIQHRKYNAYDQKNQEFQILQTKMIMRAIKNPDLSEEELEQELDQRFNQYLERWR